MSMTFFRNKRNSVVTMVIFGFIILTFIFWGFYQADDFSAGSPIAVNGEDISAQEFNRAYQNRMNQFQQFYAGRKMSPGMEDLIRKQTAKGLVMRLAMAQEADALGLLISDSELKDEITGYQAFKSPETGNFSPQQYRDALSNYGYTPAKFEREIRQDLLVQRLQGILDSTILVSEAEVRETRRVQEFKYTLESAQITEAGLEKTGKISAKPEELKTFFEAHASEFMSPERRSLEIARLDKGELERSITISEDELKAYYDKEIKTSTDSRWKEKRARALHILTSEKAAKGASKLNALKAEINALAKNMKLDEAFRRVAREKSEDYGSAARGGDLQYFNTTTMDKAFSDAVFNEKNKVGQILGPIESRFGSHIILVLDRTSESPEFKNRKTEIESILRAEKLREKIRSIKDQFQAEFVGKDIAAQEKLLASGYVVRQTPSLEKTFTDKTTPYTIVQKAFDAKALEWQAVEEFDDDLIAYRVLTIEEPKPLDLAQATPQVRKKVLTEKAEALSKEIFENLKSGKLEWKALAGYGADLKREPSFAPFATNEVPGYSNSELILKTVQSLNAQNPLAGPLFFEGRWIYFKASEIQDPGTTAPQADLQEGLQQSRRADVFDQFVEDLLKKARISKAHREEYDL